MPVSPTTAEAVNWWPFSTLTAALAIIFAFAAKGYLHQYALPPHAIAAIYCCFVSLLLLAIAPGVRASREAIRRRLSTRNRKMLLLLVWSVPYLIYAAGTGDFRWNALLRLLAVAAPLLLIYGFFPVREHSRFAWQDGFVAVLLICAVLSHQLRGVWNVPANLDFITRLFMISVAAWCWVFVREVPGLGYNFAISLTTLRAAALNFLYFALIAIPAGFALRFTAWNPRWHGTTNFALVFLEIFLFIALLEELFFRGFLQTLISNRLQSHLAGQAAVSCLFGLFHILHAPFPNWRYVLLASIAGWFYGSAFRQGGNLLASSLVHAAVDTVWRTFLTKG